mmetsp:Transcript_55273/g.130510  ORF Transcript_55273/g.130510 Transcript_55273/m.130510 type:complete len:142 (-) Transcript_55273:244-669(-)
MRDLRMGGGAEALGGEEKKKKDKKDKKDKKKKKDPKEQKDKLKSVDPSKLQGKLTKLEGKKQDLLEKLASASESKKEKTRSKLQDIEEQIAMCQERLGLPAGGAAGGVALPDQPIARPPSQVPGTDPYIDPADLDLVSRPR